MQSNASATSGMEQEGRPTIASPVPLSAELLFPRQLSDSFELDAFYPDTGDANTSEAARETGEALRFAATAPRRGAVTRIALHSPASPASLPGASASLVAFPPLTGTAGLPRAANAQAHGRALREASESQEQLAGAALREQQERLMLEHLPTVRYVARHIHERLPQHVEFEELISAGTLGLMDAARKFDPGKNVQFRSYAQFRIRGAILDSLRSLDWSPRELRRKGRAVEEAARALTSQYGRPPVESEIAQRMGLALGDYHQLLGELKGLEIATLNVERGEDSGEEELAAVPARGEDDPLFRCLEGEARTRLGAAIERLAERERLVMKLYYYEERTMKEIGALLGVVESRVSQIHAAAIRHLRVSLADLAGLKRPPAPAFG